MSLRQTGLMCLDAEEDCEDKAADFEEDKGDCFGESVSQQTIVSWHFELKAMISAIELLHWLPANFLDIVTFQKNDTVFFLCKCSCCFDGDSCFLLQHCITQAQ